MSRPDLLTLVARLVDLSTRLFSERLELARGELSQGARQAGRRAAWGIGGGLLVAVATGLFAAASVEALAPLVRSRALRLCLVAAPLLCAGVVLLLRGLNVPAGTTPDHANDHREQSERQHHVRPGAERIAGDQPEKQ
jgi:hypothetical protein